MKYIFVRLIGVFIIIFLMLGINPVQADSANIKNTRPDCLDNELLIKYRARLQPEIIRGDKKDLDELEFRLKEDASVEIAERNCRYHAAIIPTDPFFKNQWYLEKIKAPEAWNYYRESPHIVIAVIDTGVQISHPDIRDNVWINEGEIPNNGKDDDANGYIDDYNGWDFVARTNDPSPKFDEGYTENGIMHGTIVAGVAGAYGNNAAGISGVTWRSRIMPLRVLDGKGEGGTAAVVEAIDYASNNGADIINLSFVGFGYSEALNLAIKRAYEKGVLIVAAAGNEQEDGTGYNLDKTPMYPVCNDGEHGENRVIGVAAVDALDQKPSFSSFGYSCIDIAAPGVSIFSTVFNAPEKNKQGISFDSYYDGYWSGTSVAAPIVAGALALAEEMDPKAGPKNALRSVLEQSYNLNRLNPAYIGQLGKGRVDLSGTASSLYNQLNSESALVAIAPQSGASGTIAVFDPAGVKKNEFFAFGQSFRGGVNLASGDVNGDGTDEIIAGAGPGGGPHVRIFDSKGKLLGQFFAFGQSFRGGVNLASGDVNGDGTDEIIAGAGPGGGPQVRIFDKGGALESHFFAFDASYRGGVGVSCAHVAYGASGSRAKIVASAVGRGSPHVRILDINGKMLNQFYAYGQSFHGGVRTAALDANNDGLDEIITGAGPGGTPHARIFSREGVLSSSFYAFDANMSSGINVAGLMVKK
jgi:hypothetical protein